MTLKSHGCKVIHMNNEANLTATQIKTLAKIRDLFANGPVDVTFKVKGLNMTSMWSLHRAGVITVTGEDVPDGARKMTIVSINS